jgi:hypothetical protein
MPVTGKKSRQTAEAIQPVSEPDLSEPRVAGDDIAARPYPTTEEIAERAFARYQARGGEDGRDVEDWLEAERELLDTRAGEMNGNALGSGPGEDEDSY